MKSVNKVILIGRLGKDPEVRYTQGGQPVANFSVATEESWTDKNGVRQSETTWHQVVAWNRLAEMAGQYLKKGRLVYIEGRIQHRQWEDQSGAKRWTTEIIMNDLGLLDPNPSSNNQQPHQPEPLPPPQLKSEVKPEPAPEPAKPAPKKSGRKNNVPVEMTPDEVPF